MSYVISSGNVYVNESDYIEVILTTNRNDTSPIITTFSAQGIAIISYGELEQSLSLDDLLLVPAKYSIKFGESGTFLKNIFFSSSFANIQFLLQVKLNGVIEFTGALQEDSITYDDEKQTLALVAITEIEAINKKMLYDSRIIDLDPSSVNDAYYNAINPFGYSRGTYYPLRDRILLDIFKVVNSSLTANDIDVQQDWTFYGINPNLLTDKVYSIAFGSLYARIDSLYFNNTLGFNNVGDLLRQLAFEYGCYAGFTADRKPFFRKLFYYDTSNIQTLGLVSKPKYNYKTNLINWVLLHDKTHIVNDFEAGIYNVNDDRKIEKTLLLPCWEFNPLEEGKTNLYAYLNSVYYDIYGVYDASADETATTGGMCAGSWYSHKSDVKATRIDSFEVTGINYSFKKCFTYGGYKYQIVSLKKQWANNKSIIEALNLGA
jgi:hypothetical protein